VLLAADDELAGEPQRARVEHRDVTVDDPQRRGEIAAGIDRLLDRKNRRQRREAGLHALGSLSCGVERAAQHPRNRLVEVHHLAGKHRFVVPVRAGVAFARHVGAGQDRDHIGLVECGRRVERRERRVRVRRDYRPRVQQSRMPRNRIVRVQRLAGHVPARALVRHVGAAFRRPDITAHHDLVSQ
jgi:hypothetical protein